jgi:CheY-like chemotaxis protein
MPNVKLSVLLMDTNAERRALRTRIMGLHGVDVIGASDLTEASSIWHRDRYDMVLMDIRADHRGCIAFRDEIKKQHPHQIVAFLVGGPRYVDLEPLADSYTAEEHGLQWGESLRQAVRESCSSLPQRNSFIEAGWRIAAAKKMKGNSSPRASETGKVAVLAQPPSAIVPEPGESHDDAAETVPAARPDVEFQW